MELTKRQYAVMRHAQVSVEERVDRDRADGVSDEDHEKRQETLRAGVETCANVLAALYPDALLNEDTFRAMLHATKVLYVEGLGATASPEARSKFVQSGAHIVVGLAALGLLKRPGLAAEE